MPDGEKKSMKSENPKDLTTLLISLSKEEYCYLTTTGRVSGKSHEIEIWFGILDGTLYLLSGGRDKSDWVKNLIKTPDVTVRIAKHKFTGRAHILNDGKDDTPIRKLLAAKYQQWKLGGRLSDWARTALPIVIEF